MLARTTSYLLQGIDALSCEVEVDFDDCAEEQEARSTIVGLPDAAVRESMDRVRAALFNSGANWPRGRTLINLAPADLRKEGPLYDLPIAVSLLMLQGIIRPGAKRGAAAARSSATATRAKSNGTAHAQGSSRSGGSATALADLRSEFADADGQTGEGDSTGEQSSFFADAPRAPEPEPVPDPRHYLIAGELALDGRVRPIKGVIAMAALARHMGLRGVVVPRENAPEAAVVEGIEVIAVGSLTEVLGIFTGAISPSFFPAVDVASLLTTSKAEVDFADVKGQDAVKRAIVIAAAGGHNLLMLGPAGTGKSMMAKALPGVLPPLTAEEAVEITRIYSAAGVLAPGEGLVKVRPVRTPHHTASASAVIGGGSVPRPGEVSLAHRGVLFLDELPEFSRDVLETLRQPLEDHVVTISRAHSSVKFPANIMLVAAMNPTPKGDVAPGEVGRRQMERYLSKLSGPLIDRIDIHIEAPAVPWKQLSSAAGSTAATTEGTSASMRAKVIAARQIQAARQGATTPNSRLGSRQLDSVAPMTDAARTLLGTALQDLGLSARAYDKIRRVARTIADLEGAKTLDVAHISEAIGYRLLDRKI